jgi:transcriptional regulator with XRE-family HTH domain
MELANRIRQIREAHGYSQSEIAYKCNISPSAYGQIERKASNSTFGTLQKIATAIGVSVMFLVDIENERFVEKNKL